MSPRPSLLAREIEDALRAAGRPERAAQEKRYLKSELVHLGASVPAIRKVAVAAARAHPDLGRAGLLEVVEALWARGVHECRMAAVELLDLLSPLLEADDLEGLLARLLRESRTWAILDGLAANVVGPLVERHPELEAALDRWAGDSDFWMRRAALLAHLVALREGRGNLARFGRRADALLGDRELFVRKAIGWVLRDASRRDPEGVARWLLPRAARASGLTLREATKHLPAARRRRILAAAGSGPGAKAGGARRGGVRRTKGA